MHSVDLVFNLPQETDRLLLVPENGRGHCLLPKRQGGMRKRETASSTTRASYAPMVRTGIETLGGARGAAVAVNISGLLELQKGGPAAVSA